MKNKFRFLPLISVLVLVLFAGGCASTSIINSWHEDQYGGPKLEKFLVIGLSNVPNRRRFFETAFAEKLTNAGLAAETSFRMIPDDRITDEKSVIESAIQSSSADAILTTRLIDISREQSYVPPSYNYAPVGFYDYYYPTYRMMFQPGYVVTNTNVILETNVYSAATKALLWTGNTRTFNPSSAEHVVDELASIVIKELTNFGYIAPR